MSHVEIDVVDRIALDEPMLAMQNYRKPHVKVVDSSKPHSVVARSLNLECRNPVNLLVDAFAVNGKCQMVMANVMVMNNIDGDCALDVVQRIRVVNEVIEVRFVAIEFVVVLIEIEVWHIEGLLKEWL